MFVLREYDRKEQCAELALDDNLFHRALSAGEKRYHVKNPKGLDFDIVYLDNNDDIEPLSFYPAYLKGPHMAKYLIYDETDESTLYLDFFEGLRDMEFEELNEYTIALTKVVLAFTDLEVYCNDPRIHWFAAENERLHVEEELPGLPGETTFYIQKQIRSGLEGQGFNRISAT